MAFAGLSTVLVYKKEKCLVKSGKDKMTAYVYCGLFICFLWSYDQGCCGRTFKGSMHVRPEGVRTYVLRVLGRTSIEPLNELEWE